jgi:hypothetical protein
MRIAVPVMALSSPNPLRGIVAVTAVAAVTMQVQQDAAELPLVTPTVVRTFDAGPDGLELYRIRAVAIEPRSGALWVSTGTDAEPPLRIDRKSGTVRTIGRKGSGPGEYNRVFAIAPGINGEVGIWDPGQRMWFWVDSAGRHTRRWSIPTNSLVSGAFTDLRGNVYVKQPASRKPGDFMNQVVVQLDSAAGLRDTQAILLRDDGRWSWSATRTTANGSSSSGAVVQLSPTIISGVDARGRLYAAWSDSNYVILRDRRSEKRLFIPNYRELLTSDERDEVSKSLDEVEGNFKRRQMTPTGPRPGIPSIRPQIRDIIPETNGGLAITRSRPCALVPTWRSPGAAPSAGNTQSRCPFVERFDPSGRRMRPFSLRVGDRLAVISGDTAWVVRPVGDGLERIAELLIPRR